MYAAVNMSGQWARVSLTSDHLLYFFVQNLVLGERRKSVSDVNAAMQYNVQCSVNPSQSDQLAIIGV